MGICRRQSTFIFHEAHYSHASIPAFKGKQFCWQSEPETFWGLNIHLIYLKNIDPNKHGGVKGA